MPLLVNDLQADFFNNGSRKLLKNSLWNDSIRYHHTWIYLFLGKDCTKQAIYHTVYIISINYFDWLCDNSVARPNQDPKEDWNEPIVVENRFIA